MRPWMIVLWSAVLALVAAAVLIRPELTLTPPAAILSSLLPLLPAAVVTVLSVYALCAILMTAGDLITEGLRVRRHLFGNPPYHRPALPNWTAAIAESGYRRLVPAPAPVQPKPAPADGTVVLQERFQPHEARREVARLYYIGAARTHFFSALIVLAAGVVLGAAQEHSALPSVPGPIPTVSAALAVAGLALLAILARIAVDVAAEPLIEMISRLPTEPVEVGFLRCALAFMETATPANQPMDAATPIAALQIGERFDAVLEQGHRRLLEGIERLSKTADGLVTTVRSSIEALETAFRTTEMQQQSTAQNIVVDTAAMTDLRDAVVALTAVLERARSGPAADGELEPGASRTEHEPGLAQELRKLLQEIKTPP